MELSLIQGQDLWPLFQKQIKLNKKKVKSSKLFKNHFCEKKCFKFINYFPLFFVEKNRTSYLEVFKKYYFWNDVHFNEEGNKVIAEKLIREF